MTAGNARVIRSARTQDEDEVSRLYDICLLTGADGDGAEDLYVDPKLLGEVYLGAYLRFEPDLAFVLEDSDGSALGYVLGARDTVAFEELLDEAWWPSLRDRYPLGLFPADSYDEAMVRKIHSPGRTDLSLVEDYPAHLHVDVLPEGKGGGNGRRLLETLFGTLRDKGVPGLHLSVSPSNSHAIGFYRHMGFVEIKGNSWGMRLN